MAMNFPASPYLIAIVEPVREGMRQPLEVEIYERLEKFHPQKPRYEYSGVEHMRFLDSFPLEDSDKKRYLTLDEIVKKVEEITNKRKE
jgi:hypothetical protein